MKLHYDKELFAQTIRSAGQHTGIRDEFVEKDYWISLLLYQLAKSKYATEAVFKGGTSLSKGHHLLDRFSEDIDIAVINNSNQTGNAIKNLIRRVEKEMTKGLKETEMAEVTSKGSRFRKSVFEYETTDAKYKNNKLIVEINSFANPFPFKKLRIKSFLFDFFEQTKNEKYIAEYSLEPFEINVLDKEQTLMEKMVSLIRFSFSENMEESISNKIRHFYDLYFLLNDADCISFVKSDEFKKQFDKILQHDKELFDEPAGWKDKPVTASPLITGFENLWSRLKEKYKTELSALAYRRIPEEKKVAARFKELTKRIQ